MPNLLRNWANTKSSGVRKIKWLSASSGNKSSQSTHKPILKPPPHAILTSLTSERVPILTSVIEVLATARKKTLHRFVKISRDHYTALYNWAHWFSAWKQQRSAFSSALSLTRFYRREKKWEWRHGLDCTFGCKNASRLYILGAGCLLAIHSADNVEKSSPSVNSAGASLELNTWAEGSSDMRCSIMALQ